MIAGALMVIAASAWSVGAFSAEDAPGPVVARADPMLPDLAMAAVVGRPPKSREDIKALVYGRPGRHDSGWRAEVAGEIRRAHV